MVGTPSLVLDGIQAVYGMRVLSMVLCTAMFWLCVTGIQRSGRHRWYLFGLLLAMTPTVAYSSIVIAPNALEILAGALLWVSLLELFRGTARDTDTGLLARVVLSGVLLVVLRSLGPLWCLLILAGALMMAPSPGTRLAELLRSPRSALAAGLVGLATLGGVGWTLAVSSWEIGYVEAAADGPGQVEVILSSMILWPLQAIAAFPYRNIPAHPLTYACLIIVGLAFLVAAFQVARSREQATMAGIALVSLAVPTIVTIATYDMFADAWQGRYNLPFTVGLLLVAGSALSLRSAPAWLGRSSVLLCLGIAYVTAHTAGPVKVLTGERQTSPGVDNGNWVLLPAWVVGALCALGAVLMCWGAWRSPGLVQAPRRERQALEDGRVTPPPELTPSRGRGVGE